MENICVCLLPFLLRFYLFALKAEAERKNVAARSFASSKDVPCRKEKHFVSCASLVVDENIIIKT
jgi:hypothetical protein